jgi:hypothetical protein
MLKHKCKEGTRKVPKNYKSCCSTFESHTTNCVFDIRYEWWSKTKKWVIVIDELAVGGGIEISFCPHCGVKLK